MTNSNRTSPGNDKVRIQDPSSLHEAHVSHFGVLKTGSTIPTVKANFPGSALDVNLWVETSANSASITVADGMGQLISGTNSAGSTYIRSVHKGRFEAGQVTVYQSGVRVGVAQASNTKIWGLMDADRNEGIYFKMNGTSFQVCARKGGTETTVDSADFNGEESFTPGDSNSTYRIEYSAGRAIFYRAAGGKKVLLHEMVNTAEPLVNTLDLFMYYENTNSGNTTSTSMYIRGASISIWGSVQRYNESGSQVTVDEMVEAALGNVAHRIVDTKFGRNSDVDTGTVPEDLWEGGGDYTGFPTGSPETVEVFSSSANDTSAGTGARTIRITGLKATTSTEYETEDLTMNGTTAVTSSNTWYRVNRVVVLTAGTGGENAGNITCRHTTTTANVFAVMQAGYNQTTIGAYTVPADSKMVIRRMRLSLTRANGSAGSATVTFRARESGSVFRAVRVFEVQQGGGVDFEFAGGMILSAGTDVKYRIEDVSDTNSIFDGAFEYMLITNLSTAT